MRVTVDEDSCAGHGACAETCPEVFAIGPDGYAEILVDRIPTECDDRVRQAAEECPTRAIVIESGTAD